MNTDTQVVLELDKISKAEWRSLLSNFIDATVFQTWEYGAITWGEEQLSHVVLKLGETVVAAAQLRIHSCLPGIKYAYLVDGPLWRTEESPEDCDTFQLIMKMLVDEYVKNRGYSLTVYPFVHDGQEFAGKIENSLFDIGFIRSNERPRTLFLDISPSVEDLRKNLRPKWRQCLRYAEEENLQVTIDNSHKMFVECLCVYREMHQRKRFKANVRMGDLLILQQSLTEAHELKIVSVGKDGRIDACVVASAIGDTGFPMLAATATLGLQNYASYLAYWEMLKLMHAEGIHWFDFRGIDKITNPGGYIFKTGMSGKKGLDVCFLGDFVMYRSTFARIMIQAIEKSIACYRVARSIVGRYISMAESLSWHKMD